MLIPSHTEINERTKAGSHVKEASVSKVTKGPKPKSKPATLPKITFDPDEIAEKIIIFLKKSEFIKGSPHKNLTNYVRACVKGNLRWRPQSFKDALQAALNKLKDENKICFNKKSRLWKLKPEIKKVKLHPLSDDEIRYFGC